MIDFNFGNIDFSELDPAFWLTAKAIVIIGLFVYLVFAGVIIRQTKHMTDTLEIGFEGVIKVFAWLHMLFALGTFVAAFVIL